MEAINKHYFPRIYIGYIFSYLALCNMNLIAAIAEVNDRKLLIPSIFVIDSTIDSQILLTATESLIKDKQFWIKSKQQIWIYYTVHLKKCWLMNNTAQDCHCIKGSQCTENQYMIWSRPQCESGSIIKCIKKFKYQPHWFAFHCRTFSW